MSLNTTGEPLTNNFIAELWSIQVPGNFETPIARAYFDKPGVFDGGIVHIPRDEKLGRWVVIKVWNKSLADSYDDSPVKGRSDRIFVWYGNQQTPVPLEIEAFKIGECDGSGRPWKRSTGATLGDRFVMAMIESCDPDHEWFLNDTPIPTPENNVLVIDRFKESDAGVYSIVEEVDGTEITHLTRVFLNRNGLGLFSAAFIDNTFQCYIYPSFGNAYILEKTNDSALNLWSPVQAAVGRYRNNDQYKFVTNDLQNPTGFYRVRRFQVSQGGLAMPFEGGTTAPNSVQGHEYRVRILDGRGIFGDDGVFQIQFDRTHNNYSITGITDIQSSTGTYAYQTSGSNQGTLELTDSNVGSTVSLNLTFNEAQAGVIILKSAITDDFQGQHSRGFVDSHPAEEEAPNNRAAVRHSLVYDFWRVLVKDVSFTGQAKNRAVADSRLFRPSSSDGQSNSIPTNL